MVTLVAAVLVVIVVVLFVTVVVIIVKVVVVVVTVVVAIVIFLAVLNYDSDVAVSLCSIYRVFTLLCALFLMLNRVLGNTFSSEPRRVFHSAFNFKQSFEESENSGYSW